jgi:hypothetical protein
MKPKSFTRVCFYDHVKSLVAEARRVKYTIIEEHDMWVEVRDDENKDALVFRAVRIEPKIWAVTYSTQYWGEATP